MRSPRVVRVDRPKGLIAILVVGVALGGMGFCSSLLSLAHLLFGGRPMADAERTLGAMNSDLLTLIVELGRAIEVAMTPWRAMMIAEAALGLLACSLLLLGASRGLRLHEDGRRLFLASLVASTATGLLRLSLGLKVNAAVQRALVDAILDTTRRAGGSATEMVPLIEKLGEGVSFLLVGLSATWLLLELAYVAGATWYLTRPEARRLYGSSSD